MAERKATTIWEGSLAEGKGTVDAGSGAFSSQEVSWATRTGDDHGKTSPEELMAAAHASCYAMAFSHVLGGAGHTVERLEVTSEVGFGPNPAGGMKVTHSHLTVKGRVPGIDQATFSDLARTGEQNCPVSNALRNNLEITVNATLES
jgi:osmotically inducible protein OsmC